MNDVGPNERVFKEVVAEEWQFPVHRGYLMKCCDCGLVHSLDFGVLKAQKTKRGRSLAVWQGARYFVAMRARRG